VKTFRPTDPPVALGPGVPCRAAAHRL